jgi:putative endonuclease
MREFHVYILASHKKGALYVGVTSDLARRLEQHRRSTDASFTRRYAVHHLVHVEVFGDSRDAIAREKRLKKWPRAWKLQLIERDNPEWRDLAADG